MLTGRDVSFHIEYNCDEKTPLIIQFIKIAGMLLKNLIQFVHWFFTSFQIV